MCVCGGGAAWLVSGPLTTFSLFHRERFHHRLLPEPFTAETEKLPETGSGPSRSCLARGWPGGFQHWGGGLPDQAVQSFGHKLGLIYIFSDGTKYRNLFSLLFRREKGGEVPPSVTSSPFLVIQGLQEAGSDGQQMLLHQEPLTTRTSARLYQS